MKKKKKKSLLDRDLSGSTAVFLVCVPPGIFNESIAAVCLGDSEMVVVIPPMIASSHYLDICREAKGTLNSMTRTDSMMLPEGQDDAQIPRNLGLYSFFSPPSPSCLSPASFSTVSFPPSPTATHTTTPSCPSFSSPSPPPSSSSSTPSPCSSRSPSPSSPDALTLPFPMKTLSQQLPLWLETDHETVPVFDKYRHRPDHTLEKKRIEAAGGIVKNGRLYSGCLSMGVSRSFGDIAYKKNGPLR